MKDAAIIIATIGVCIALITVIIAILPFLIAIGCIVLIYWMIAKFLVGGFSAFPPDRD
jgi:hypothetical protein